MCGVYHPILVTGDKIGLSICMMEYDDNFNNSFDFCVEEMHKEGLDWAYESSMPTSINLIKSGIEKSRFSLDLITFLKSFYV